MIPADAIDRGIKIRLQNHLQIGEQTIDTFSKFKIFQVFFFKHLNLCSEKQMKVKITICIKLFYQQVFQDSFWFTLKFLRREV